MFPQVVMAVGVGYAAIKLYAWSESEKLAAEYRGFTGRWYNSSASSTSTPNTGEDHPPPSTNRVPSSSSSTHGHNSSTSSSNTVEDHPPPSTNRVPSSSSSTHGHNSSTSSSNTVEDHPPPSSNRVPSSSSSTHGHTSSTSSSNTVEDQPPPSTNRVPSSSSTTAHNSSTSNTLTDSTTSRPDDSTPPALSSSVSSNGSSTVTQVFCVKTNTTTPTYEIPENIVGLPGVLKKPLSPSTYKDYFASLLYAEDYYVEKWSNFSLSNVTLELHKAAVYEKPNRTKKLINKGTLMVSFQMDSIPARRPFLLSRDFVFVRPSGGTLEPFQGILHRVVKNTLLVEFKDDFHSQHHPNREYDVSFSFNRVCLKQCHKAIETAATNSSLLKFLFPDNVTTFSYSSSLIDLHQSLIEKEAFAILHVRDLKGAPPYLIEGPPSVTSEKLSKTGKLIQDMVLQIIRSSPRARVLLCAPLNNTCDVLMRSLKREIPKSDIFRANAAFPSRKDLKNFKVIISTFASSFRLNTEGITAGHFSHIFMVDASSATEPETMVTLANLVGKKTAVVVTGTKRNFSRWVRSDIGRRHGLQKSYFQRLFEM